MVNHKWQWHTWTNYSGNSHKAIIEKAQELGATAWDFGQADHELADRAGF